jgi:transposase
MPRTTKLNDHLTVEELGARYRRVRDPVERSHAQIVWLIARGRSAKEAAQITGYSARWVSEVVRRYNEGGPEALGDRRHENPGGRFLLEEDQRRELADALGGPAPDGGLWTGPKVASWIEEKTGKKTHPQRGWVYLKRLGFSLRRPRPRHHEADQQEQEAFKKTSPTR